MTRNTVLSPQELSSARPGPPLDESQAGIAARVAERIRRGDLHRDVLDFLVAELKENFPAHAWTGVYLTEGESLVLGPFRGPESPHHRIRIGAEGICGWVALHGLPQVIPDVNADPRYLACSAVIRSEIVVPIVREGTVLGVIDVDSETPAAFTKTDLDALTEVARLVAPILPPSPGARR
ncbi:MAG TPA: GAF domain-containing protein [Candidatus Eisenbacteria bacterium]